MRVNGKGVSMKLVNVIALLMAVGFAAPPVGAVPIPGPGKEEWSSTIQVAGKKAQKNKHHNYSSGNGFIPGYVPTPYGRGDCIGWWEPIGNGLYRCHGQFISHHHWRD
jgi:hypothetical protein